MKYRHQWHFKVVESAKLFHLVRQAGNILDHNLPPGSLRDFLERSGHVRLDKPLLDGGSEVDEEAFARGVSQVIEETVTDFDSQIQCNYHMLQLMMGNYHPDRPLISENRLLVESELPSTAAAEDEYKRRTVDFHNEVRAYREQDPLEPHFARINYCLASIYLSEQTFKEVGYGKLVQYTNGNLLQRAVQCMEQGLCIEESCKTLLLASEAALVHADIAANLTQRPAFKEEYSSAVFVKSLGLCNERTPRSNVLLAAFLANLMRLSRSFSIYLLQGLCNSPSSAQYITRPLANKNAPFNRFLLDVYNQLSELSLQSDMSSLDSSKVIMAIEEFAVSVLRSGNHSKWAIRLIASTVRHSLGDYCDVRDIKLALRALKSDDSGLISAVLMVLEGALSAGNKQVVGMFLNSTSLWPKVLAELEKPFLSQSKSLHCLILEILCLLSAPEYTMFLNSQRILECLRLSLNCPMFLQTCTSLAVRNWCNSGFFYQSDSPQITVDTALSLAIRLASWAYRQDIIMSSFLNGIDFLYFDQFLTINCLKAAYDLLSRPNAPGVRKSILSQRKLVEFLELILWVIDKYPHSYELLRSFLKEEVTVDKKEVSHARLMYMTVDLLLMHCRESAQNIKKTMVETRNLILAKLYSLLTYDQIVSMDIPVLVLYQIDADLQGRKQFDRLLPISLTYDQFHDYMIKCLNHICNSQKIDLYVPALSFKLTQYNRDIKNDKDYKEMIKRLIMDQSKQYCVQIQAFIEEGEEGGAPVPTFGTVNTNSPSLRVQNQPYSGHSSMRDHPADRFGTLDSRRRSRSPYQARSPSARISQTSAREAMCENCGRVPSGNNRFCHNCNRR